MLITVEGTDMTPMTRHILHHCDACQLLFIKLGYLVRVGGNQLILLIPMSNESRTPPSTLILLEEEAGSAIALRIDFGTVNDKPLSDSGFHFCHRPVSIGRDICGYAVASVHNKRALVHASFQTGNEVQVVHSARPCGVDVGVRVKQDTIAAKTKYLQKAVECQLIPRVFTR